MKQTLFKNGRTLLFFALLFTLLNCSKDDDSPQLPAITQTGENTFGCYIDGKLLTPRDGTGTFNSPDHGMIFWGFSNSSDAELAVRDFKSGTGGLMDIHIFQFDENGEGTFIINESNCEDGIDANDNINIRCRWWDEAAQSYKWYCSTENSGTLTITRYDFDNRIVSGTFSCTVQNRDDSNDIIEITEGRFDIKWDTLDETDFP